MVKIMEKESGDSPEGVLERPGPHLPAPLCLQFGWKDVGCTAMSVSLIPLNRALKTD